MNLEKFLTYVTHHSETIIQWLFFAILLLAGTLIARSLFSKKSEEPQAGGDLQSALEKILAQTTKLESVSVDKLSAQGVAQVEAQVQTLKADLAAREQELNQIKAGGGSSEQTSALSERIKELEAKLSEYEILEDDIADLSLYKEENARLKAELDRMKTGGAPAATAAAAVAAAPPAGDEIVAEFAEAVSQEPQAEPVASPELEIPDTGDPMADFESTVQLEKQLAAEPAPAPAPVSAPPQHTTEPVAAAAEVESQKEADDLFAEFSNAAPEEGAATLDTDKMMAEMEALVGMEPATDSALEESIDTDKMAEEATSFSKS